MSLQGQLALVTGASRGIGHAIAKALASEGAHIIALARTQGGLEALDDEIKSQKGDCTLVPMDLTKGEDIDKLGPSIYHRFGKLDLLIHAAGALGPLTPAHQLKPKEFERLMALTAFASQRLIISTDPLLRASRQGRAIFLDDALAQSPQPFWGGYQAAKAAMRAIVESYRLECAKTGPKVELWTPNPSQTVLRRQAFPGEPDGANPHPDEAAKALIQHLSTATATERLPTPKASA